MKENWVDIANKKSDGSYPKCGRSGGEKKKKLSKMRAYCKSKSDGKGQRAFVRRKQAKANQGPTPDRARRLLKRKIVG